MVDREKPHADFTNDWNYDASCTLTSFPVLVFENLKRLVFVAQSVLVCGMNPCMMSEIRCTHVAVFKVSPEGGLLTYCVF
jgi:hypothetical protein